MGMQWDDKGRPVHPPRRQRLEPVPEPVMSPLLGLILAIALIVSAAMLTVLYLLAISD